MGHNMKNGSHSEKFVTLGKIDHNWRNGSLLKKWVTVATSIVELFLLCTGNLGLRRFVNFRSSGAAASPLSTPVPLSSTTSRSYAYALVPP